MADMRNMPAAVLGGGSWGTALAEVLARAGHAVTLVVRKPEQARTIMATGSNPGYLPGFRLSSAIRATAEPAALAGHKLIVLAVPCQSLRAVLRNVSRHFDADAVLVNAAKGVEVERRVLPSVIVRQECPGFVSRYAVLSGPSFAREVMEGKPTAVVLGCAGTELGADLRAVFSSGSFRTYSCSDVVGVELGGSVKNIIAIAAGIADGLGFGHNARAALITRGLAEMRRLGKSLGARQETFMGLSGLGDLLLTCAGDLSRNRRVGLKLAEGKSLTEVVASLGMVAEGVQTAAAVHALAQEKNVEMPVTEAVFDMLYGRLDPFTAVERLLARPLREE